MVGDTERTTTDRKRDRRIKKHHQKKKAKMQEKKLQEKVRQAGAKGGTGKLDRSSTMKVIEKAVKSGQVKLLEGSQDKAVKSSQTFFKQLQDTRSKKQKNENTKKRKKVSPCWIAIGGAKHAVYRRTEARVHSWLRCAIGNKQGSSVRDNEVC
ncbi:hypothetical protein E2C01_020972 [Portunus trituberculatus]|uniref:Uncharacterized protein n=1 Tax=Portunus trituberculatus TaxID=210409 RepID=A0A5B7E371_PORTR|nr:hypothetical protein [Portunus trituberculatus]